LADVIIAGIAFNWLGMTIVIIGLIPALSQRILIHSLVMFFNLVFVLIIGFGLSPGGNGLIN